MVLVVVVAVVVLLVVQLAVTSRFPRQFERLPAKSGPGADRIWLDLSGAAGCFVVVGVVVVGGGGGGVVGGIGCYQSVSPTIPASSGQFRAQSSPDPAVSVGGSGLVLSLSLVVAVVSSVASSGAACQFPRQLRRVPANSGPGADGIWLDLSGAAGWCRCCCRWWWWCGRSVA